LGKVFKLIFPHFELGKVFKLIFPHFELGRVFKFKVFFYSREGKRLLFQFALKSA